MNLVFASKKKTMYNSHSSPFNKINYLINIIVMIGEGFYIKFIKRLYVNHLDKFLEANFLFE